MSVQVISSVAESINYVTVHLGMQKIIKQIEIKNCDLPQVVCRVYAEPEFIFEYKEIVELHGDSATIPIPALKLNDEFYRSEMLEARDGEIKIEIFEQDQPDKILGFSNTTVHIQPYLHWDGAKYPDSLAGFLQPNDTLVMQVIKRAGEYAAGDEKSMCGYQCRSEEGVAKQAEYIYRALQDMELYYISAPASFEEAGQKIRIPHQVLHDDVKQGTCLDLAVLFATCLEAVSLNAVIVVISGHAFAGVWLTQQSFSKAKMIPAGNEELWTETMGNILPIECTTFTEGKEVSFGQAVEIGRKNITACRYLIDIGGARNEGITPVYTYTDQPICDAPADEMTAFAKEEFSTESKDRLQQLREQAMDITARSRLLNFDASKTCLTVEADIKDFLSGKLPAEAYLELLGLSTHKKKKETLRELFSKSKQSVRESGKSNLFVTFNELRYKRKNSKDFQTAVMYLCPVEIYRNKRGDLQLRYNPEEIFFNPALRVSLAQEEYLDMSEIVDNPGEDYKRQLEIFSFLIGNEKSWSIKEKISHLTLCSIPNEAIWNGLNDETITSHEIVRGILDRAMTWENEIKQPVKRSNDKIYPFETDSSQSEIIEAAFERKAQLIVGPAGNGKTQTVVNIILEAIRRGEKVLFVSEMAPAMEVAHDKLKQIFGGKFHLKMIYGKDKTNDLIAQLQKTLDFLESERVEGLTFENEEAKKKYEKLVGEIQQYYEFMNRKGASGKSMEEFIEMYEKYANCMLRFDVEEICKNFTYDEAEANVSLLASVMEGYEHAQGEYAEYIRYDNLEGREEEITLRLANEALSAYEQVWSEAMELREQLQITEKLSEKARLQQMMLLAKVLRKCPVYYRSVETLLADSKEEKSPYIESVIDALQRLREAENSRIASALVGRHRVACEDLLRKVFNPGKIREIIAAYLASPAETEAKLRAYKIISDENGRFEIVDNTRERENFLNYQSDVKKSLQGESREVRQIVDTAIEKIVAGQGATILNLAKRTYEYFERYSEKLKAASDRIIRNGNEFAHQYPNLPKKILLEEWIKNRHIDTNRSRSVYDRVVVDMERKGFSSLIRQITEWKKQGTVSSKEVVDGFRKAWAKYHIDQLLTELSGNYELSHIVLQDKVSRMIDNEKNIRESLAEEIIRQQLSSLPNIHEGVSNNREFGVLQQLVRSPKLAIRTFFEKAPNMIQAICPCMIMDPEAVAEYIPSDFPQFDLVLIDEGSQMPTYNALIPIARAKRCMIFGDEKQLQPLETFKKQVEYEDDLYLARESILTAAYFTSMPRKMLRFHYRSEKEGLIAFSNHTFYNGDIITFPSCDTTNRGVSYEFVEDGVYDKAGTKTNRPEAERVIAYIRELYEALPEDTTQTLGVITLNIHQRDLIQSLLLQETKEDSELGMKIDDLVSVVNLESCQGKEWDYVVLSPGFGNDQNGNMTMGFGALNQESGPNRLNVMITRARKNMHVITSIKPYMLASAKSAGVLAFRDFLKYAMGETTFDSRVSDSGKRAGGLIDSVAAYFEKLNYTVHINIGSSGFKVDLGIVDPEDPNKYCLGILIDHFHDRRISIHDQEVIFPESLKQKGWKIYRLRELNWVDNQNMEINQILKILQS